MCTWVIETFEWAEMKWNVLGHVFYCLIDPWSTDECSHTSYLPPMSLWVFGFNNNTFSVQFLHEDPGIRHLLSACIHPSIVHSSTVRDRTRASHSWTGTQVQVSLCCSVVYSVSWHSGVEIIWETFVSLMSNWAEGRAWAQFFFSCWKSKQWLIKLYRSELFNYQQYQPSSWTEKKKELAQSEDKCKSKCERDISADVIFVRPAWVLQCW